MELTGPQLQQVKEYVARGCHFTDVQLAVTKHVKYRVQQILAEKDADQLTADNSINYRLQHLLTQNDTEQLNDVLIIAHKEFGPKGFKIFEATLKAEAKNKYSKLYWQALSQHFTVKQLLIDATIMLWCYLFFVDVQPPPLNGIFGAMLPYIFVFAPQYLVNFSLLSGSAKRYKKYYTLLVSNMALYPWCLICGTVFMLISIIIWDAVDSRNFTIAGVLSGLVVIITLIFIKAGITVRRTALNDCRALEVQSL